MGCTKLGEERGRYLRRYRAAGGYKSVMVDMISGMEVKEDDPDFMNAVDYMFAGLENASRIALR